MTMLGYELGKEGTPHNCLDDATPLVGNNVPAVEMSKLYFHKIAGCLTEEKLHKVIARDFTITNKVILNKSGKYSLVALFKNQQVADQVFDSLHSRNITHNGLPQKSVIFQLSTGTRGSFCVRKMYHDSSQSASKKRPLHDGETSVEPKKLKESSVGSEMFKETSDEPKKLETSVEFKNLKQVSAESKNLKEISIETKRLKESSDETKNSKQISVEPKKLKESSDEPKNSKQISFEPKKLKESSYEPKNLKEISAEPKKLKESPDEPKNSKEISVETKKLKESSDESKKLETSFKSENLNDASVESKKLKRDECCSHLKEIESLKQELILRDDEIYNLNKIITALTIKK